MGETNNTEQITQERQRKSVASQETSVSGGTLMLAAYMCFWALIFGYLMYLYMGQRNIEKEQKILETKIDELSDRLIAAQEPENE